MPYQNDMSTLADVVSPAYAAQQMGIQNDTANAQSQLDLAIKQGQAPALMQEPGLKNLYQQAQTGYTQGLGMAAQAKGIGDLALLPSSIQAGQAENQTKITQSHAQQLGQFGQLVGQVAGIMEQVPPAARPAAMQHILQQNNIDPNQVGPLINGDPAMLRDVSQRMVVASGAYQQMLGEQGIKGQTERDVANIHGQYGLANTQALVQGRQQVAETNAQAKMAGIQQVIGQLTKKVADGTATEADRQALAYANQTQQMIRSGNPMASQLLGIPTESNVPGVPSTQPTVPNTSAAGGGGGLSPQDVEAAMRARGLLK
jgi:hypothetical protein